MAGRSVNAVPSSFPATGTINFTVVVDVVLAVMFFAVDALALPVFRTLQIFPFLRRDHTVRLGPVFPLLQAILTLL